MRKFHQTALLFVTTMTVVGCAQQNNSSNKGKVEELLRGADAAAARRMTKQAEDLFSQALKLAETDPVDELELVVALNRQAAFHEKQGGIAHSRVLFMRAVERTNSKVRQFLTGNNAVSPEWLGEARKCLIGLADCYAETSYYSDAKSYYQKAVDIEDKQGKSRSDPDSAWMHLSRMKEHDKQESQALMDSDFWKSGRLPGKGIRTSYIRQRLDVLKRQRSSVPVPRYEDQLVAIYQEAAQSSEPSDDDYRYAFESLVEHYRDTQPRKAQKLLEEDLKLHGNIEDVDGAIWAVRDLYYLTQVHKALNQFPQAVAVGERCISALEKVRFPRAFQISVLDMVATCKESQSKEADACPDREKQLALSHTVPGFDCGAIALRLGHDYLTAHKWQASIRASKEACEFLKAAESRKLELADALNVWACALIELNQLEEAEAVSQRAVAIVTACSDLGAKRSTMSILCHIINKRGRSAETIRMAEKILTYTKDPNARFILLQQIGDLYGAAFQLDAAEQYYARAEALAPRMSVAARVAMFEQIALLKLRNRKWEESYNYYEKAVELAKEKDAALWIGVVIKAADAYLRCCQYDVAERLCSKALASNSPIEVENKITLLRTLASIEQSRGLYDESMKYFDRAEDLLMRNKETGKQRMLAQLLQQRSDICIHYKQYDQSISCSKLALQIYEKLDGEQSLTTAESLMQLASRYLSCQKVDQALQFQRRALEIHQANAKADPLGLAHTYLQLADTLITLHKWDDASKYLQDSIEILAKNESPAAKQILVASRSRMAAVYQAQGKKENADEQIRMLLADWKHTETGLMSVDACYTVQIADYLNTKNFLDASNEIYKKAVNMYVAHGNPIDTLRVILLDHYALLLRKLKRSDEASRVENESAACKRVVKYRP